MVKVYIVLIKESRLSATCLKGLYKHKLTPKFMSGL